MHPAVKRLVPERLAEAFRVVRNRRRARVWGLPVAFICGPSHSGTTILTRIMFEHSAIYVPMHETWAMMKPRRSDTWREFAVLQDEAHRRGARMVVEKTPRHVRYVPELRRMFPGCRFILTMRDGRDVAASYGRRVGNFAEGVALWSELAGLVAAQANAPDCLLHRYEDFVADPSAAVARVCAFLGLAFEPEMLRYHERSVAWSPDNHTAHGEKRRAQVSTPIFDGRGASRDFLPPDQLAALETGANRQLMARFGYI